MDYQQFYGKYGPESRVHDRMEGFGMPMPLLSRIQATPGSWEFFAQLSPQLQNRMAGYVRAAHSPEEQQWRIEQVCEALKARDGPAQWQ